jgi:hypothetical protein
MNTLSIFQFVHDASFLDFIMVLVTFLLGLVAYYSQQQAKSIKEFRRENTVDHMNIEKKIVEMDTWTHSVHENQIEPAFDLSKKNQLEIIDVREKVRNHEGRIKKIEQKVK